MPESAEEFLERLRDGVRRWGGAEWLAARVEGDAVIVLYRQRLVDRDEAEDLVEGARLVVDEIGRDVFGPGDYTVDDVLAEAILEIVEPHGIGVRLDVSWADGLTDHPEDVRWHGYAVEHAGRHTG